MGETKSETKPDMSNNRAIVVIIGMILIVGAIYPIMFLFIIIAAIAALFILNHSDKQNKDQQAKEDRDKMEMDRIQKAQIKPKSIVSISQETLPDKILTAIMQPDKNKEQEQVEPTQRFCSFCGAIVNTGFYCSSCGHKY